MAPPLVVDIDGTLSRDDRSIEGRVVDALHDWPATVVVATGKAFPYPVALCDFVGLPYRVIAENGGVVFADDEVVFEGDREACERFAAGLAADGHGLGWGDVDVLNRWRETELAISRDVPRAVVDEHAAAQGLQVIDSGYAYHVTTPAVNKGRALETLCDLVGLDPGDFVAVGDSENDAPTFGVVGESYAVANADEAALAAADHVTEGAYGDGLLEVLDQVRG